MCVAWLIYMCDMTHLHVWHLFAKSHLTYSYTWLIRLIHMCDMIHSYVWHDSFTCVKWLIYMCDMTNSYVWHVPFTRVTWLIHMCDMIYSYVWHDSFICVTWLIHMCDMIYSYVWHDSFICVTWLIHVCDMPHSWVWCVLLCVTFNIHTEYVKHTNESRHTYKWVMSHIWTWLALGHIQHPYGTCQISGVCLRKHNTLHLHNSFICVTLLIHICDKPHSWMWCVLLSVTFNIHTEYVQHIYESRHAYEWVMSHIWTWLALCHIQLPTGTCQMQGGEDS